MGEYLFPIRGRVEQWHLTEIKSNVLSEAYNDEWSEAMSIGKQFCI